MRSKALGRLWEACVPVLRPPGSSPGPESASAISVWSQPLSLRSLQKPSPPSHTLLTHTHRFCTASATPGAGQSLPSSDAYGPCLHIGAPLVLLHGKEGQTFCFSQHRLTYVAVPTPIAQWLKIKVCFSRTLPVHHQLAEARFCFPFPGIQAKRATTLCLWHRESVLGRLSRWPLNTSIRDASGSPVVKNSMLPVQGVQVRSLIGT